MNCFFFALTFLTRIPSPYRVKYNDQLPSKSMLFYPLIGTIIGLILVSLDIIFSFVFSDNINNVLLLIGLVYITGGLHLDGFIDTIDGIFSCREKDKILEIMHDSLIGSFGAIAIILLLLLKYNLFLELGSDIRLPLFILMPSISRWVVVVAAYRYPLATSSKLGKGFNYYLTRKEITIASIYLVLLCLLIIYIFSFSIYLVLALILGSYFIMVLFANFIIKKIDGLTGDVYGAINEITEVMILIFYLIGSRFIL